MEQGRGSSADWRLWTDHVHTSWLVLIDADGPIVLVLFLWPFLTELPACGMQLDLKFLRNDQEYNSLPLRVRKFYLLSCPSRMWLMLCIEERAGKFNEKQDNCRADRGKGVSEE